jgi:hypothetical protein
MDFKKNPLNQSLITKFLYKGEERENTCPKNLYHLYIIKTHKYSTDSMRKGHFFETLCIGRGSGGQIQNDLPRKKLLKAKELENIKRKQLNLPLLQGEKTSDQERIEQQAKRFKILCAKYQITPIEENTQTKVIIPWHKNPDIYLKMEFDIFPTAIMTDERIKDNPSDTGLRLAIIDIKLTADLNSTYGEYCWGSPEYMDHSQGYMYHYGARQIINHVDLNPHMTSILTRNVIELIREDNLRFYYWVFNYKKELLEDKLVKVNWDPTVENELHEMINKTINLIEYNERLGWPTKPDYKVCKECPVFDCKDRESVQSV